LNISEVVGLFKLSTGVIQLYITIQVAKELLNFYEGSIRKE
jgi:hypothetical protein